MLDGIQVDQRPIIVCNFVSIAWPSQAIVALRAILQIYRLAFKRSGAFQINPHRSRSNTCQAPAQQPKRRPGPLRAAVALPASCTRPAACSNAFLRLISFCYTLRAVGARLPGCVLWLKPQRSPAPAAASATKPPWAGPGPPRDGIVDRRGGPDGRGRPDGRGVGSPRPAGMRNSEGGPADSEGDAARAGRAFSYVPVETTRTRLRDGGASYDAAA